MNRRLLSLKRLSNGLSKDGAKEMTGRSRGARIREAIEKVLGEGKGTSCVVLDFSGIGAIDFSWADEVVAKMVSRLWSGEYGEKFLLLKGLTLSQAENIHVALERKRLAVLTTGPRGWRIIGSLNNYLVHTLNQVMKRKRLTLRQLSEEESIGMNTSGTRLLNLYKKRLVARMEGPTTGRDDPHRGRQFVYRSLLS
ncbi:MAG: STAS-like domain-containing protein [Thermodesulfobacteriota bacterium]|jgi:hypothetical protein